MKLARLIKLCVNETGSRVRVGKHLYDMFRIKNGLNKEMLCRHCLLTLLWGKPLGVFRGGLKLNGTHQLLAYAGDVNVLGGRIDIIRKTQKLWLGT